MRSKNVSELPRGGAVALYAFTFRGLRLATRLADILDCAVYVPFSLCREDPPAGSRAAIRGFSSLAGLMRERFHSCRCHIFVAAAGIAVRAIAPFLRDKAQDPAVVVLDQRGRHVVSLLSGHLGGGNAMAEYLAAELGAEPVITTASDLEELPAVDVLAIERGLILSDTGPAKKVAAALLAGKSVPLSDPGNFLGIRGGPWESLFPPFPSCAASPAGGSAPSPPPWLNDLPPGPTRLLLRLPVPPLCLAGPSLRLTVPPVCLTSPILRLSGTQRCPSSFFLRPLLPAAARMPPGNLKPLCRRGPASRSRCIALPLFRA